MFRTVRAHLETERADGIVLDLYRRKCLKLYQGRFANESVAVQDAWIAAHGRLVREFIPEELEHRLESPYRERAHFVRQGDRTGLLALRATETAPVISATVAAASWSPQGLDVAMDISVEGRMTLPRQLLCTLQPRGGDGLSGFPLVRATPDGVAYGLAARYEGGFPRALIDALLAGQYDVHVVSLSGAERLTGRVQWGASVPAIPARDGLAFYSTKGGHASIRKSG